MTSCGPVASTSTLIRENVAAHVARLGDVLDPDAGVVEAALRRLELVGDGLRTRLRAALA